jgi:hypothetical protein
MNSNDVAGLSRQDIAAFIRAAARADGDPANSLVLAQSLYDLEPEEWLRLSLVLLVAVQACHRAGANGVSFETWVAQFAD